MIRHMTRPLTVGAIVLGALAATAERPVVAQGDSSPAVYEFMKATEDRVWRLNRQTGEISVCTLTRDTLLCSTSSGGAETPATTYEELQQREAADAAALQAKEAEERERALQMLDRMVEMFKEFVAETTPGEQ